jgi:Ni,Fe-hydrogenase I cytochrome b subunit
VRQCYALLLVFGSIPGFALSGAMDYNAIYAFRFFVGWIGGSFGDNPVVHFAFTMLRLAFLCHYLHRCTCWF